jgi:mRNA-degrading endonuclease RelE of RelBE toxin-antitoxin system
LVVRKEASHDFHKNYAKLGKHHPDAKSDVDEAKKLMDEDNITPKSNLIQRKKWPSEYKKKYKMNNLWRYELSDYHRLIFTIVTKHHLRIYRLIDVLPHPEYDKIFGYG